MTPAADRKELVRLVELDYERTADFINGVTGTAATIRGWAITVWLAIIGIALDRELPQVALLALAAVLVFFLLDGYHAWLYGEALAHAAKLERISGRHYDTVARGSDDEDLEIDVRVALESHRFGMYRNFRRFRFKDLRYVKPYVFFQVFYPFLAVLSVAGAIFLGVAGEEEAAPCTIERTSEKMTVTCGDVTVVDRPGTSE